MLWHLNDIYLTSPFVLLPALSLNRLLLSMHVNSICSLHTLLCRQTMVVCVWGGGEENGREPMRMMRVIYISLKKHKLTANYSNFLHSESSLFKPSDLLVFQQLT